MKGKFRKEILNGQLRRKMDEPMEIWKRLMENSFGSLGCIDMLVCKPFINIYPEPFRHTQKNVG